MKVGKKCTVDWKSYFSNVKITEARSCSKVFLKFLENSRENTWTGASFLIKASDGRLETCIIIETHSSTAVFLLNCVIF